MEPETEVCVPSRERDGFILTFAPPKTVIILLHVLLDIHQRWLMDLYSVIDQN